MTATVSWVKADVPEIRTSTFSGRCFSELPLGVPGMWFLLDNKVQPFQMNLGGNSVIRSCIQADLSQLWITASPAIVVLAFEIHISLNSTTEFDLNFYFEIKRQQSLHEKIPLLQVCLRVFHAREREDISSEKYFNM